MDHIALLQQQLGQKCAILTGYAGDERDLGTTIRSAALRHIRNFLVLRSPPRRSGDCVEGQSKEARIPSNQATQGGGRTLLQRMREKTLPRPHPAGAEEG